jgi:hypothetical protein
MKFKELIANQHSTGYVERSSIPQIGEGREIGAATRLRWHNGYLRNESFDTMNM